MAKTILEILKETRDLLANPVKWGKGWFYNRENRCYCLVGGLGEVSGHLSDVLIDRGEMSKLCQHLADTLPAAVRKEYSHNAMSAITDWNDKDERTHAEVLKLLDDTIERLEKTPCES